MLIMTVGFLLKHLSNEKPIVKSGRFLSVDSMFYRYCDKQQPISIKIKDSCKIIQMPLKDFGKSFKLDVHKEVMPYKIYTKENIDRVYIPILEAVQHINDKDTKTLLKDIDK